MAGAADAMEEKRERNIRKKEEERAKRVEEIKAAKAVKAAERASEEAAKEAVRRQEAERQERLAETEKKRQDNIAKKEAEHKAKADALKERKGKKAKSKYSKSDVLLLKQVYDEYDRDKSGSVSVAEMQLALKSSALAGSTDTMLSELDRNGDGSVDFHELLKVRARPPARWHSASTRAHARRAHATARATRASAPRARPHHRFSGTTLHAQLLYPFANATDFAAMVEWVAPPLPPAPPPKRELSASQLEEIRAIFALYDKDGSGGLTVKELKQAMKDTFLEAEEVEEMYRKADVDDNKLLDLAEFRALMVSTGLWDVDG